MPQPRGHDEEDVDAQLADCGRPLARRPPAATTSDRYPAR